MKRKVSVIIPTYKGQNTLNRAVQSALNQNGFDDYEIIVVDDNKPDSIYRQETEMVMQQYIDNEKVMYIKHAQNLNGAAARNTGFKVANGEYICFLDDDDVFLPDKLRLQTDYMDNHKQYACSYTWRYERDNLIYKCEKCGDLSKELLSMSFYPTTITLMIRREAYIKLCGFDESFKRHQDFEFLLRFFKEYDIGVVNEPLSKIIGKDGTESNCLKGKELELLKEQFLNSFKDNIDNLDKSCPGFRMEVYSSHYAEIFASHVKNKNYLMAMRVFVVYLLRCRLKFIKKIFLHYKEAVLNRYKMRRSNC